jgi:hypothetical protein
MAQEGASMNEDPGAGAFGTGQGAGIQDFIIGRELAEVYLLLDNISSSKTKSIPSLDDDPVFKRTPDKTWLEQICDIAWPPEQVDRATEATNAAKLIRAKDMLNLAAAPATGASIAFTLTVVGESTGMESGLSWWRRLLLRLGGAAPPAAEVTSSSGFGGGSGGNGGGGGSPRPPSRASLAALSYPTFAIRAWRYRAVFISLPLFLILWLILTCAASWDIATGSALVNRVNALDTARLAATTPPPGTTGAAPLNPPPAQRTTTNRGPAPASPSAPAQPTTTAQGTTAANNGQPAPGGTTTNSATTNSQTIVNDTSPPNPEAANDGRRKLAAHNLESWMDSPGRLRRILAAGMGGRKEQTTIAVETNTQQTPPQTTQQTNVEWGVIFIGILAGTILPIFYGLLGAAAAVVRSVSAKLRDSTLMPRDLGLAYVQLALGAVIGACVGLFVTSDGNAAGGQGLLGSVHLSAPALCFVGGFGVEGVFLALESLIRRVFNIDQPKPPATTTTTTP